MTFETKPGFPASTKSTRWPLEVKIVLLVQLALIAMWMLDRPGRAAAATLLCYFGWAVWRVNARPQPPWPRAPSRLLVLVLLLLIGASAFYTLSFVIDLLVFLSL